MKSLSQNLEHFANQKIRDRVRQVLQQGSIIEIISQEINTILAQALNSQLIKERDAFLNHSPFQRTHGAPARNGFKTVSVPGFLGRLFLKKPDLRRGSVPSPLLTALRTAGQTLAAILAVRFWCKGASTRATSEILSQALGTHCSHSYVSTLSSAMDPIAEALNNRRIPGDIVYLLLDATYLSVKRPGQTRKNALLAAVGLDPQGRRHFLGLMLGDRESLDAWETFLRELVDKGLQPLNLRLVLSDDHKSIVQAVTNVLGAPHQLCLAHKIKNLRARVARSDWKGFRTDFKAVYWTASRESSLQAYGRFEEKWKTAYPKAVSIALDRYDDFSRFMNEPRHTWKTLRTTNLIENLNKQIKRRTKPAGAMHSEMEILKLVYSVVVDQEKSWMHRKCWRGGISTITSSAA